MQTSDAAGIIRRRPGHDTADSWLVTKARAIGVGGIRSGPITRSPRPQQEPTRRMFHGTSQTLPFVISCLPGYVPLAPAADSLLA